MTAMLAVFVIIAVPVCFILLAYCDHPALRRRQQEHARQRFGSICTTNPDWFPGHASGG